MSSKSLGDAPRNDSNFKCLGEAPRNDSIIKCSPSDADFVLSVRRSGRTPKPRRHSASWIMGSSFEEFDESQDSLPSLNIDSSIDRGSVIDVLTQIPDIVRHVDTPAATTPSTPEEDAGTTTVLPVPSPAPKRKASEDNSTSKRQKRDNRKASNSKKGSQNQKPDTGHSIWYCEDSSYVTPFLEASIPYPQPFCNAFSKFSWGPLATSFTPSKLWVWNQNMSSAEILKLFQVKTTIPNTLVWLPFIEDICVLALTKLFRICFTNDFSIVCLCPLHSVNTTFSMLLDDPKHGTITFQNPVVFCSFPCMILFLNCPDGPHISVPNSEEGLFTLSDEDVLAFQPKKNFSLVENTLVKPNLSAIAEVQKFIESSKTAEAKRQQENFQCDVFPPVKLNDFVRKRFPFDIHSNGPHFYPSSALKKLYPKTFTQKPKLQKPISYKQYNHRCGDDSKITGHPLAADDMFCSTCGKVGHLPEICWMRFRSAKELGLTSYQDIVLNWFLAQLIRAPSLRPLRQGEDKVAFLNELDETLDSREEYFLTSWRRWASEYQVSADLVEPGFSQIRQGLAFWYAISCPIFILQWVAFGIPVFWFFNRPPPFEVRPHSKNGKWEDSSEITIKSVQKFLDLQFIVPLLRQYMHCCAPLFDRQSSGSWRCIHDLRFINRFIMKINFTLFTAFNFCNLAADGAVFIVTDFSKCWHQLKHLSKDMKYFVFRTVENGQVKYWLPLGKTFGESDVPFQITELISYVTALFSLFTLCSFWIDDGIIQVGNVNEENWKRLASRIRIFTAKIFSKLCLIVNDKCDFQPSIEKPWVGLWNAGRSTFLKAEKLEAFGTLLIQIMNKRRITLTQAQTLQGKINSFSLGLRDSYRLKILNSLLKSIIQILDEQPTLSSVPISDNFGPWVVHLLNILLLSLSQKELDSDLSDLRQIFIACDASNIGGGLVIESEGKTLFESSQPLPISHILHSNMTQLESSSTDNERFIFEDLALKTSKAFLDKTFPDELLFLKIFTDSLPLAVQLNTFRLKSLRASLESDRIMNFLEAWGMPFQIHYHPRTKELASKADANTRYFVPTLKNTFQEIFNKLSGGKPFRFINISEALLCPKSYFSDSFCEIIPQNLTTTLYTSLFQVISRHCTCPYIFCPKLSILNSVLFPKYSILFAFSPKSFHACDHSFSILPFLLVECSEHRLTRDMGVTTVDNQVAHRSHLADELARPETRKQLEGLLSGPEAYQMGSWKEFDLRPVTYEVENSK